MAPGPPPTPDRRSAVDVTAMSPTYPAAHQLPLVNDGEIADLSLKSFYVNWSKHLAST